MRAAISASCASPDRAGAAAPAVPARAGSLAPRRRGVPRRDGGALPHARRSCSWRRRSSSLRRLARSTSGRLVLMHAQRPLADIRPLVAADEGATAGLVLDVLDALDEAADPGQQLVVVARLVVRWQ